MYHTHSIKPPAPKLISEEEFERLIAAISKIVPSEMVLYWENFLYCASDAGLRLQETIRLRWSDFNNSESNPLVIIKKQKNGIPNENVVPTRFLTYRLKKHAEVYGPKMQEKDDYFFFGLQKRTKYITANTIQHFFIKLRKAANLDDSYSQRISRFKGKRENLHRVSYHTLRHLYCQRISAGNNPQPIHIVQGMMRHRSINSTLRYFHYNTQIKRKVVEEVFNNPSPKVAQDQIGLLVDSIKMLKEEVRDLKIKVRDPYQVQRRF